MKTSAAVVVLVCCVPTCVEAQVQQAASGPLPALSLRAVMPPEVVTGSSPGEVVVMPGSATAQTSASAATPANPDRTKQRQSVLGKLTFDRRPSSILKAWSTPPKSEDDETTAAAADEGSPRVPDAATPDDEKSADAEKPLTEEEQAAKEAAQKAADKKKEDAARLKQEVDDLKEGVERFKRNVTLAEWGAAAEFISTLEEAEQKSVYAQLLSSLVAGPPGQPKTRNGQIIGERNTIRATDVIALAEMCPTEKLEDSHIGLLGGLANFCQVEGQAEYIFLDTLTEHVGAAAEDQKTTKRIAARILFAANRIEQSQGFLPRLEEATKEHDTEALDVLSDVFMRLHAKEREKTLLEQSWRAAQALLDYEKTEDNLREKALRRCVQLVPMIREELGDEWLTDSFTSEPERGMEILNAIGGTSARSMKEQMGNPDARVATLKLQQTAVDALLKTAPERADSWQKTLHLLAANWLREATYSVKYDASTQRGSSMSRDMYGNYFWSQSSRSSSQRSGMPQPIPSGKVLDGRPGEDWLKFLDAGYRSRFSIETARLHLRVKEETEAFPYIEQLAATHKDDARDLVQEFLNVWAENHDPNTQTRRTSIYMFSYGFSQRASGIPLTRSRQVRNLAELATWAKRIRQLPIDDIDERWISAAFTRVHSSAEVYRLEDMQRIFGAVENMEPKTLAGMLQTMRANLAGIWRKPQVQQQNQTNRKKKDIEAEVVLGYESANKLCRQALTDHPDSWELHLVDASLQHDRNDYRAQLKNSAGYAEQRKTALSGFRNAVTKYVSTVPDLKESEYSVQPFQFWFNASLGAPDLDQITQDKLPVLNQIPLIREAIESLPKETREQHRAMFANDLFTRMSHVNPAVKFRYVREGLAIVGDHEQAREARKVYDYYKDLVTEIKLEAVLDGSPAVGHEQPFGVFVNLRHTKAIERESGGFARYLQNQNSGSRYSYNYGRPTENYRDKFEQTVRDALDEHFEVLSVTFQPENITSRATAEEGWRTTSYAYVLLQARGPEIDRVAPLKLDLDFLDTTGYAVLPVESQALSIDCGTTSPDRRPLQQLSVIQTLDERQAEDDRLVLEVKATGQGLVPELDQLLDLSFADFEVVESEDNGLSVSRFDPESSAPVVVSDRLWTITLADRSEAAADERTFMFASARLPLHEEVWQRYDDADLVEVEQTVALQEHYDEPDHTQAIPTAVGIVLCLIAVLAWWLLRKPAAAPVTVHRFQMPASPTAFNVLSLLKDIERNNGLSADGRTELGTSINRIERYYFADHRDGAAPDLQDMAESWVRKAR